MAIALAAMGKAHGKAILIGEHFVLSGTAALVVPLPELTTEVELYPSTGGEIEATAPGFTMTAETRTLARSSLERVAGSHGWDLVQRPLGLRATSLIPVSRGFGSSAAFSVALCRAFAALAGVEASDASTERKAREIEDLFHGRSSGLDIAGAISNDPVVFEDGQRRATFRQCAVDLVVVDSGPRRESSSLVQGVLEFKRSRPADWISLSGRVSRLTRECREAIEDPQGADGVSACIARANEILDQIGLVGESAKKIIARGRELGALTGKISGAGSGGALLLVTRAGQGRAIGSALSAEGIPVLAITAGEHHG